MSDNAFPPVPDDSDDSDVLVFPSSPADADSDLRDKQETLKCEETQLEETQLEETSEETLDSPVDEAANYKPHVHPGRLERQLTREAEISKRDDPDKFPPPLKMDIIIEQSVDPVRRDLATPSPPLCEYPSTPSFARGRVVRAKKAAHMAKWHTIKGAGIRTTGQIIKCTYVRKRETKAWAIGTHPEVIRRHEGWVYDIKYDDEWVDVGLPEGPPGGGSPWIKTPTARMRAVTELSE